MNKNLKTQLEPLLEAKKKAQEDIEEFIKKAIENCDHEHVVEVEYQSSMFGRGFSKVRICRDCGYAEDPYYYSILYHLSSYDLPKFNREKMWQIISWYHYEGDGTKDNGHKIKGTCRI